MEDVMEAKEDAEKFVEYKMLWEDKVPSLIVNLESIKKSELNIPLLKYESVYAPIIRKIDIIVFENGKVQIWKSKVTFLENKPEIRVQAQLKELLNEIKRVLDQETLQKQKSCFQAVKDGYNSTWTLYLKDKLKVIHNSNCTKSEFSLSYQYLDFLLSSILSAMTI